MSHRQQESTKYWRAAKKAFKNMGITNYTIEQGSKHAKLFVDGKLISVVSAGDSNSEFDTRGDMGRRLRELGYLK